MFTLLVSALRGSSVGIRGQPPLPRVSSARSVAGSMKHACARWRGLNTRHLTTQVHLFLPADAGGRAARLFTFCRRMAAQYSERADHTNPPLSASLTGGAARAGCFLAGEEWPQSTVLWGPIGSFSRCVSRCGTDTRREAPEVDRSSQACTAVGGARGVWWVDPTAF